MLGVTGWTRRLRAGLYMYVVFDVTVDRNDNVILRFVKPSGQYMNIRMEHDEARAIAARLLQEAGE